MFLKESVEEELTEETNDLDVSGDEGEDEDPLSSIFIFLMFLMKKIGSEADNDDDSTKSSKHTQIKNIYELSMKSPSTIVQQSASSGSIGIVMGLKMLYFYLCSRYQCSYSHDQSSL